MSEHPSLRVEPILDGASIEALVDLLEDSVEDGASVGFLAPLDRDLARRYWRDRIEEARQGRRTLLGAWKDGALVGSAQLAYPAQENGSCRAEVQRVLVHRRARGRGLAKALMEELERVAKEQGRLTLFLNTRADGAAEQLYLALGYVAIGRIPNFALNPDGTPNHTTIMYKSL